ncbi:CHAT domain-containing tetratricopeptide repeat protein [Candidatus Protochlamydia sp. R18]|uniref:CHAT domain-containing tetratricopeptide repeat protein n=1 Tax=Candidatus Protochlamydia sp. R18 TaxID=1353977 RepID=UPI0005AACBB6|nr:CHAT domain-containing protein [Candidatus Protochlamydia sp. R18]
MHVESAKFSTPYYLHYPHLPTISLVDHVKGLIEAYKTKSNPEEDIAISAKLLLEEIKQLEDIGVQRECLCRLLKLEIEEIQNLIVEEVALLFDFKTLFYDIQHDQAQQLIHLEEIISEIMEAKLKSNELNFVVSICVLYQSVLEHLWLLPHLEFGNHCANLLIQNKNAILSKMERWKDSLDQLASEEKISRFIPKNLEMAILRLFEPLLEDVAKEIEEQKSVTHKSGEISLTLLEIIADFYRIQKDFPRAIFHAEILLNFLIQELPKTSQKEEFLVKIMHIHGHLARWYQLLNEYPMAIDYNKKALKIARELDDPYAIFIYLRNMGKIYLELGEGGQALPLYGEAQVIAKSLQDPKSESLAFVDLAHAYLVIDKNDEAISCFQAALNLTEDQSTQALIYTGIGQAHANSQRYQPAEEAYQRALKILPQNNFLAEIKIHGDLAAFFNDFSRYGKAISQAEKILGLLQHPSIQKEDSEAIRPKFNALTVLGSIYGNIGDYKKELDYKMQALEIAKKAYFFPAFLGIAYANLGSTYCHMENYPESIRYYIKALGMIKEAFTRAKILVNLGQTLFLSIRFADAIKYYNEANAIGNSEIKKFSFNGLGLCYEAIGNKDEAIKSIEKSICLSQASGDRHSEAISYYHLGQLYRKSDPNLAEMSYRKSIEIYVLLHQELKNHSHWQITFFESQVLPLLRLETLLLKQKRIEEALQVTDFRRSRALVSALTEKFKCQKDNSLPFGITTRKMQATAQKLNTCFIVYSLSPEDMNNIIVWIIPSQGKIICQKLPLGILTEEVKAATQIFQTFPFIAEARTIETPLSDFLEELTRGESSDSLNTETLKNFKNRLRNWYEILIAPIESYLPKDSQQVVTIIPDSYLAQIPFAAFLDKEGTYLIEKHPLSIAPSIEVLTLLDQLPKVFPKDSLVIGNPITSERSLKFAEKEAQTIVAPLLETAQEKILLQDKATVHGVVGGMVDARWIHLACHGSTGKKLDEKIDPHSVFEGLFKLTSDEEHPQGYLYAQKIAMLSLRAELVFMSACFSGRGKPHGEGIVGPVWSFLAAGALSTIATYWRLPDTELTLQMVEAFYRHLLGIGMEKLNKAQALQKATLVGIEQARERPDRWGAFFLSGLYE